MMLPFVLVAVLLGLDRLELLPERAWSEQRPMTLDFEVHGVANQPLEGVEIGVVTPSGKSRAVGRTGPDGSAKLVGTFVVSGTANLFRRLNDANVEPFQYSLTKSGYVTINRAYANSHYVGRTMPRPRFKWSLTPIAPVTEAP
jgi:hypothetical protein